MYGIISNKILSGISLVGGALTCAAVDNVVTKSSRGSTVIKLSGAVAAYAMTVGMGQSIGRGITSIGLSNLKIFGLACLAYSAIREGISVGKEVYEGKCVTMSAPQLAKVYAPLVGSALLNFWTNDAQKATADILNSLTFSTAVVGTMAGAYAVIQIVKGFSVSNTEAQNYYLKMGFLSGTIGAALFGLHEVGKAIKV